MINNLFNFIDSSPSPFHASENAATSLSNAGFNEVPSSASWNSNRKSFLKTGGSIVAISAADKIDPKRLVFNIVGAHTDSPNLRIKPIPDRNSVGYQQLGVEIYGGALLNSWLDRDLGLSGQVCTKEGHVIKKHLFRSDQPLLRVPQLAIHLDRNVNEGLTLDRQSHLTPIWGLGESDNYGFRNFLANLIEVEETAILSWDAMAHDLTPSTLLGKNQEFYSASRIDNLASCHAAIEALCSLDSLPDNTVAVAALFDHEEVGSNSNTGAAGPLLDNCLERIVLSLGGSRDDFFAALARSWCLSADGAHAVHPNYVERHDSSHKIELNAGPVIKINANVRYATQAEGTAHFQMVCDAVNVPTQLYSHRSDLACGSTIGPITATRLGIRVVDIGSAQLSMHSAREMGGSKDPGLLTRSLTSFYQY